MTHCAESKRERACLHGGGGPQVGEAKYGGSPHLSCKRDQITMRDYMDKRVTSPTWKEKEARLCKFHNDHGIKMSLCTSAIMQLVCPQNFA